MCVCVGRGGLCTIFLMDVGGFDLRSARGNLTLEID